MDSLPNEILTHIFEYIIYEHGIIHTISLVCHQFNNILRLMPQMRFQNTINVTQYMRVRRHNDLFIGAEINRFYGAIMAILERYNIIVENIWVYEQVISIYARYKPTSDNTQVYIRVNYNKPDEHEMTTNNFIIIKYNQRWNITIIPEITLAEHTNLINYIAQNAQLLNLYRNSTVYKPIYVNHSH
jgi:hypothetical protein